MRAAARTLSLAPIRSVCGSNQYNRIRDTILTPSGLTEAQVQAVWVNAEDGSPTVSLPQSNADAYGLEGHYGGLIRAMMQRWPNVKQVFFSSQIYTGFATTHLDPEPYAYESGFAVKWTIEAQIVQRRTGTIDPIAGDLITNAPFIAWGPYLWGADSQNPPGSQAITWLKSDVNSDGTHPDKFGIIKVVGALTGFFMNSPYTPWFR